MSAKRPFSNSEALWNPESALQLPYEPYAKIEVRFRDWSLFWSGSPPTPDQQDEVHDKESFSKLTSILPIPFVSIGLNDVKQCSTPGLSPGQATFLSPVPVVSSTTTESYVQDENSQSVIHCTCKKAVLGIPESCSISASSNSDSDTSHEAGFAEPICILCDKKVDSTNGTITPESNFCFPLYHPQSRFTVALQDYDTTPGIVAEEDTLCHLDLPTHYFSPSTDYNLLFCFAALDSDDPTSFVLDGNRPTQSTSKKSGPFSPFNYSARPEHVATNIAPYMHQHLRMQKASSKTLRIFHRELQRDEKEAKLVCAIFQISLRICFTETGSIAKDILTEICVLAAGRPEHGWHKIGTLKDNEPIDCKTIYDDSMLLKLKLMKKTEASRENLNAILLGDKPVQLLLFLSFFSFCCHYPSILSHVFIFYIIFTCIRSGDKICSKQDTFTKETTAVADEENDDSLGNSLIKSILGSAITPSVQGRLSAYHKYVLLGGRILDDYPIFISQNRHKILLSCVLLQVILWLHPLFVYNIIVIGGLLLLTYRVKHLNLIAKLVRGTLKRIRLSFKRKSFMTQLRMGKRRMLIDTDQLLM